MGDISMNVVVFNTAIGTSNNGDYIIYNSAIDALRPLLDNSFVMEFGSHLKNLGLIHYMTNSFKCRFANNCDYKFVLGTNLLSPTILKHYPQWPIMPLERRLYRDCIMMGVGLTKDAKQPSLITKSIYSQIMRRDIIHSVREDNAKAVLEKIPGVKAINTGCPSLWPLDSEKCQRIPKGKAKNAIISVSGYGNQTNLVADQRLVEIVEKNYDKVYIWGQTTEDIAYFNRLRHTKDAQAVYSLRQFGDICTNGNVDYIGTRLHGAVFAMQHDVRAINIIIDHRAREFNRINNINAVFRENIDELEDYINHDIVTNIRLNEEGIRNWLGQFPYC